jgi:hypothetical protein
MNHESKQLGQEPYKLRIKILLTQLSFRYVYDISESLVSLKHEKRKLFQVNVN